MDRERIEINTKYCFICYKKDASIYIGNGLWRHEGCVPGSSKWMKSFTGKRGSMHSLFKRSEEENNMKSKEVEEIPEYNEEVEEIIHERKRRKRKREEKI